MQSIERMIDKALRSCLTKAEIARRLGVTPQRLNDWQSGYRSMPDEKLIELAHLAGVDEVKAAGEVIVERVRKKRAAALAGIATAACLGGAALLGVPNTSQAKDNSSGSPSCTLSARRYVKYLKQKIKICLQYVECNGIPVTIT